MKANLILYFCLLVFLLSLSLNSLLTYHHILINTSPSLPYGIYKTSQINNAQLKKGDLVLVCLNQEIADFAYSRNYILKGKCPQHKEPIGKYIVATNGDIVNFTLEGIMVNQKLIPHTQAIKFDSYNRPLPRATGSFILRKNEYIIANPKINSFDSRYFGIIHTQNIYAYLKPIYLF